MSEIVEVCNDSMGVTYRNAVRILGSLKFTDEEKIDLIEIYSNQINSSFDLNKKFLDEYKEEKGLEENEYNTFLNDIRIKRDKILKDLSSYLPKNKSS
ncbi:MAG: hypothetical protein JW700_00720 [Candidatus Aenigmarchaeota archaeon]|nr:hypothetical protein [Candidatus Aenigmarchaeota archaeon]